MIRELSSETCLASIMAGIAVSTTLRSVFATNEKPDTPINADNITNIAMAMNESNNFRPILAVANNIFFLTLHNGKQQISIGSPGRIRYILLRNFQRCQ